MGEAGLDALLVTDPFNYYYLSGHKVGLNKMRPWFMILPLDKEPVLIEYGLDEQFSRLYAEPYPAWVPNRRYYTDAPYSPEPAKDWGIANAIQELGLTGGIIGTELGEHTRLNMTYNDFELLRKKLPHAKFTDAGGILWKSRMVKSPWEVENLQKACEIGCKAWQTLFESLKTGVSVKHIHASLLRLYVECGADIENPGGQMVKGARGPEGTFQRGDILYLDGGPYYRGYKMDASREAVFGEPTSSQKKDHKFIWGCCEKIVDTIRPGIPASELHHLFNKELKAAQRPPLDPVKRIGHGIGLEGSEPPSLNAIDQTVLEEGISITPEPRIETADGLMVAEEHVVVTASGCEVLSKSLSSELFVVP